jgi:hypothetical protein
MRISGLFYRVLVCLAIFSAYALAQTVAVAHIIYEEGNVLYYADNESNFVYKAVEKKKKMVLLPSNSPTSVLLTARKILADFSSDWAVAATHAA